MTCSCPSDQAQIDFANERGAKTYIWGTPLSGVKRGKARNRKGILQRHFRGAHDEKAGKVRRLRRGLVHGRPLIWADTRPPFGLVSTNPDLSGSMCLSSAADHSRQGTEIAFAHTSFKFGRNPASHTRREPWRLWHFPNHAGVISNLYSNSEDGATICKDVKT